MEATLFSDEIISSTDLKNNQKKWFERALKSPVSITSCKGKSFVLMNREQIQDTYAAKEYAEKIILFLIEVKSNKSAPGFASVVFPWAKYLNTAERSEFLDDLMSTFKIVIATGDWPRIGDVVESWEATAEALTNSKFMDNVALSEDKKEYTVID
jgi:hypothetical protein